MQCYVWGRVLVFGGLASTNALPYHVREETDGQVRWGKPRVLSLSSTKSAADVCDFLRDGDKWCPLLLFSLLLSWFFSVSPLFCFPFPWSFILSFWSDGFAPLAFKHSSLFSSLPLHSLLLMCLPLFLFRQISYAQKPWRIRWTQCGTKRSCITASQRLTWPPKHSGRLLSSELLSGQQLALFPRQPSVQFIMQRMKMHASNPPVGCQQPPVLPSWLFQVIHYCNRTMPANCSPCCCCGNCSGVVCPVSLLPPSSPQCSPYGAIEVKHRHLGPKSLTHLCHVRA